MLKLPKLKRMHFVGIALLFFSFIFVGFSGSVPTPMNAETATTMAADATDETSAVEASTADSESQASKVAFSQEDALWLARGIYSETKRPEEQELVAWVIRNRVETAYRGNSTIKDAVLDPYQFSAFNPGERTRNYFVTLTEASRAKGFANALRIAESVLEADVNERPFSHTTRHFYSERSMPGGRAPNWAAGQKPVPGLGVNPVRFRFYENVN